MIGYCVGCLERIRWWQKKDLHGRPWHFRCFASWEKGYRTAQSFAQKENALHGYKGPWDLYGERAFMQYKTICKGTIRAVSDFAPMGTFAKNLRCVYCGGRIQDPGTPCSCFHPGKLP